MTFTDDDLKRLRQAMQGEPFITFNNANLNQLLARLEAAELYAESMEKWIEEIADRRLVGDNERIKVWADVGKTKQSWRKACGK